MIEIRGLSKTYGTRARPVHALRDVSLRIEDGVWAIVGPNGAGKTTLLGLILGFLRPSAGQVTVDGLPPRRYLRHHGAAYLPERFRLPPEWPTGTALRTLARLDGTAGDEAEARAAEALRRLGLADHADKAVGALSRGLTQRLGLAQALAADRDLVVLDEPTEGLDPLWRVRFREIVGELRRPGRTVLLASHDLAEVERLADRVILVRDGEIREVLTVDQPPEGPLRYRLHVRADDVVVRSAFPDARQEAPEPGHFVVTVRDDVELSARLTALLDAGAIVHAVTPLTAGLEERVRRSLEEG